MRKKPEEPHEQPEAQRAAEAAPELVGEKTKEVLLHPALCCLTYLKDWSRYYALRSGPDQRENEHNVR
jgi:hypothetical protein